MIRREGPALPNDAALREAEVHPTLPRGRESSRVQDGSHRSEPAADEAEPAAPDTLARDGTAVESLPTGAAPTARAPSLARLYEEELRVDGRFRWSVGGARPVCSACRTEIAPNSPFHTVLVEAAPASPAAEQGDPLEVFERRDLCEGCFTQTDRSRVFAFWKSVLPSAKDGEAKKSVNVVSLRAYFDRLIDSLGEDGSDPVGGPPANASVAAAQRAVAEQPVEEQSREEQSVEEQSVEEQSVEEQSRERPEPQVEGADPYAEPDAAGPVADADSVVADEPQASAATLAYLLGLFLVRKRSLRWGGVSGGVLTLGCRASERIYRLPAPRLTDEELERGIRAFEELFG